MKRMKLVSDQRDSACICKSLMSSYGVLLQNKRILNKSKELQPLIIFKCLSDLWLHIHLYTMLYVHNTHTHTHFMILAEV